MFFCETESQTDFVPSGLPDKTKAGMKSGPRLNQSVLRHKESDTLAVWWRLHNSDKPPLPSPPLLRSLGGL